MSELLQKECGPIGDHIRPRCHLKIAAGHPVGSDIQMAMDARRGYLSCLCTAGDAELVAIVWDLRSGRRGRPAAEWHQYYYLLAAAVLIVNLRMPS
jgi:hypothetical protein